MNDATSQEFSIGAPGIDTNAIVEDIRATVARKIEEGIYADPRIARAERHNLLHLKNDDEFLDFYLDCLREAVFVDIGDFEIVERRARFSGLLVRLKRTIWSLLRFYTYRLWSQQNQTNGLLLSAIEGIDDAYKEKIASLEERLAALEDKTDEQG